MKIVSSNAQFFLSKQPAEVILMNSIAVHELMCELIHSDALQKEKKENGTKTKNQFSNHFCVCVCRAYMNSVLPHRTIIFLSSMQSKSHCCCQCCDCVLHIVKYSVHFSIAVVYHFVFEI